MSNYSKIINYATKDALSSGDPLKKVSGTELDAEFSAIQTAISTKQDTTTVTGSFTATLTGMSSATTGTINYIIANGFCTLYNGGAAIQGASNANSMTMTGLPVAVQPATARMPTTAVIIGNSVTLSPAWAYVSGSSISFYLFAVSGTQVLPNQNVFPAIGANKGLDTSWLITYPL